MFPKKLDVSQTKNPDVVLALQSELSKRLEQVTFCKGLTEETWAKSFREEVNSAARETIEVLKKHHQDWFDERICGDLTMTQRFKVSLLRSILHTRPGSLTNNQTRKGTGFTLSGVNFRSNCAA